MRTSVKRVLPWLAGLFLPAIVFGADLSFRVYGGLGYVNGGDFSRSVSGWRSYYQDRQDSGFSSSYDLGEMHGTAEVGAEAVWMFAPRWGLSLGVGYIYQKTSGEITTRTIRHENIPTPSGELWTFDLEQMTKQNPVYKKSTIPVTVSLDYSLVRRTTWTLVLGGGGGIYPGRLALQESYTLDSESISEMQTENGVVQYIDRLNTVGDYSEKTRSTGLGLHGRIGLDLKLGPSTFLSVTVLGRWVNMKGWEGTLSEASEWQWSYGLWGANSTAGTDERTEDGQYWMYDLTDEKTGKSYPVLVFRDSEPSSSSRPANLSLSGISVRVCLGFRFGGES